MSSGVLRVLGAPLLGAAFESEETRRRWTLVWVLLPFADEALALDDIGEDVRADLEAKRSRWEAELAELRDPAASYFAALEAGFRHGYGGAGVG